MSVLYGAKGVCFLETQGALYLGDRLLDVERWKLEASVYRAGHH